MTTEGHLYDVARRRLIRVAHGLLGIPRVMAIARKAASESFIAQRDDRTEDVADRGPQRSNSHAFRQPCGPCRAGHFPAMPRVSETSATRFRAACVDEGWHLALQRFNGSFAPIQSIATP